MHGCLVSAVWFPRLLRQHSVVLRVHHDPCWSHSAELRLCRFSSSLTHTDVALWCHEEQHEPGTGPTKAIWSLADVSKHACGLQQCIRTARAPFATSVCLRMNLHIVRRELDMWERSLFPDIKMLSMIFSKIWYKIYIYFWHTEGTV